MSMSLYDKELAGNGVLRNDSEVVRSIRRLRDNGLFPHYSRAKSWDTYKMISMIATAGKNSYILDVGCNQSPILVMLRELGFVHLYGCDLVLKPKYPIFLSKFICAFYKRDYKPVLKLYYDKAYNLSVQNLENTTYQNNMFDYITSLSVIEHGVDTLKYFKEMNRILKRGGYLLTSTDYWPEKIVNTRKVISPNAPDNIFDRKELDHILRIAESSGFSLIGPMDYTFSEKVVRWKATGFQFTYVFFAMKKDRDI